MSAVDLEKRQQRTERIRNGIGLAILIAAFAWSVVHVAYLTFGPEGQSSLVGNKRVLRLAHWQLEGGYRQGMDEAMREYERLHPDVVVEQIGVPERTYGQWVNTQLMGRTAPDLIEVPNWLSPNTIVRYFVPLSDLVDRPNPYNVGTELEGVPWRQTYTDGMQGGYRQELQDYYGVPTSIFTVRCFANMDLLKEAAGVTEPPKTLTEFLKVCQDIQNYARKNRRKLVPIAGSDYTAGIFHRTYQDAGMYPLIAKLDFDFDGEVTKGERLLGEYDGHVNIETDPYWEATHKILYDISRFYNPGFLAAKRDQAIFLFAQGNAAMIATGTWDAGSIWFQVEGDFPIGVFDFPMPSPGDKYYSLMKYTESEAGKTTAGLFGLTKFSRNPDLAIDFMQFLTSRKENEKVNASWRWFPAIRGRAQPDPILEKFTPRIEGVYSPWWDIGLGGDTIMRYDQLYQDFISTAWDEKVPYDEWLDQHYKQFIHKVHEMFKQYYFPDFVTDWKNGYSGGVQTEVALSLARAQAMRDGLTPDVTRNIQALMLGQIRRMQVRAVDWAEYEQAKKLSEAEEKKGAATP